MLQEKEARHDSEKRENLHIDISAQSLHTSFHGIENMLSRQSHSIHQIPVIGHHFRNSGLVNIVVVVGDAKVAFCQQHKAVARDIVLCDCLADNFLAAAVGVDVGL